MWNFKKHFFRTEIIKENVVIIPDFDYAVFTYQFSDGKDLDTWTRVVLPQQISDASGTVKYMGFAKQKCIPNSQQWTKEIIPPGIYADWAGDNTGIGVESVLVDLKKIKQDFPLENIIKVDLRCAWYGTIGILPVEVKAIFYKGGQMTKSGYKYSNFTFIQKIEFTTSSKPITTRFAGSPSLERFATFTFNKATGEGSFDLYDMITPTI